MTLKDDFRIYEVHIDKILRKLYYIEKIYLYELNKIMIISIEIDGICYEVIESKYIKNLNVTNLLLMDKYKNIKNLTLEGVHNE